jgi:hypothetical protein
MTQNWKNLAVIALVAFSLANCSKAKTTSANSNAQQHNEDVTNIKSDGTNTCFWQK